MAAGDSLTDAGELCASAPGWLCKRVLYEGDLDYFNWPERTYNGTDLHVTADTFEYEVTELGLGLGLGSRSITPSGMRSRTPPL